MHLDELLLHLSLIQHIGPATIEKLVQALPAQQLLTLPTLSASDISYLTGLPLATTTLIHIGLQDKKILDTELALIDKHAIQWLSAYNPHYPELLKTIYLPPVILYVRGAQLASHANTVAFVGSRQADAYGYKAIQKLVPETSLAGITIISGGALGIDTMAHKACLDAQGKTVAVLGSGLLKPYPAVNTKLFETISDSGGSVISPFSLQTSALAGNFPARNRIIAGLSKACIVVQATYPSGALITARYALEQGREVGAVPGPIDSPLSVGCHKLITDGATVITSAQDIQALLSGIAPSYTFDEARIKSQNKPKVAQVQEVKNKIQKNSATNNIALTAIPTTPKEIVLYAAQTAVSFDDLNSKTQLMPTDLQALLLDLQLDGLIDQTASGLWHVV